MSTQRDLITIFMPSARIFARCNRHPVTRLFLDNRVGRQFLSPKRDRNGLLTPPAQGHLDLRGQVECLDAGLYGGEEKGNGGDELCRHALGLGDAFTGACGQIGLFGHLVQPRPIVGKALGDPFGRLRLPGEEVVRVVGSW